MFQLLRLLQVVVHPHHRLLEGTLRIDRLQRDYWFHKGILDNLSFWWILLQLPNVLIWNALFSWDRQLSHTGYLIWAGDQIYMALSFILDLPINLTWSGIFYLLLDKFLYFNFLASLAAFFLIWIKHWWNILRFVLILSLFKWIWNQIVVLFNCFNWLDWVL